MTASRGKVLLAMSGGVDSSVAAALLLREGYEVVGVFMRLGSPGEQLGVVQACGLDSSSPAASSGGGASEAREGGGSLSGRAGSPSHQSKPLRIGKQGCCSINDAADARLVAAHLGVPFYVVNFKKDFGRIIDYFTDEYAAGRTPNPCVRCNDWLKFGKLHDYAWQLGCDFVASGHYARIDRRGGLPALRRGIDHAKDQSYVLFGVPPEHLEKMLLPVGEYTKPEVRAMAEEMGLPVFDKADSQEVCFVPDQDYAGLVERRRPEVAVRGDILNTNGEVVGAHDGQHRFTIGQRRGVGVALGYPIYVVDKDPVANTVTVGGADELLTAACTAGEANWLTDAVPRLVESGPETAGPPAEPGSARRATGMRILAQYRYNSGAVPAMLNLLPSSGEATPSGRGGRFRIVFDEPQRAVAPGQAIVLYDAGEPDRVLGGGWIEGGERA